MAKQRASVHLDVPPEEAMRLVRQVIGAHARWRTHSDRATYLSVTEKGTAFARSPKVEISAASDDVGEGSVIDLTGTVVGFGPNQRHLDKFVAQLESGIRALAGED